ncbi:MAG: HAD family hydrolase [Lachnospiraceae bacterium]|nr:HAD family hydrolase [Lachnospiraceae bacterium]MBP3611531.1 HAD family hydrolase [Lachnospiraceae bacterium]
MEYIFLDLDGTITDSREGITKCFEYALNHFGIEVADRAELERYIGPPLEQSFREGFGFDAEKTALAVAKYRERFVPVGMFENRVYDGMEDALQRLKEAGKVLIVATSKPEYMAVRILEHFGLDGYFDDICGSDEEQNRSKKDEVIRYALEKHGITDVSDVLMVGDRKFDVIGAGTCGLQCMGVLYGFGDREELEAAGAAYIAETPQEMAQMIVAL